jgi:predicted amidohydrolase
MPSYDWRATTAGNAAISPSNAPGDHAACDAEITRLRARVEAVEEQLEHAKAALAGDNEGIRLWMLDCGELVAKHRKLAAYWHGRWTAAMERADEDGTQAISQHVRIQELERRAEAAEARAGEMEERYDRVTLDLKAAEAKLAEVRDLCQRRSAPVFADILAITGSDGEAAFARQLVAQAEAADAGYKVAAVRAGLYEFLHQYGRSALPAFKVAIDLAVSLRKIIGDLGSEEEEV